MSHSSALQSVVINGIAGVATGGSIRCGRTVIEIRGAGKELPYEQRAGLIQADGSIDFVPTAAAVPTLIDKALYTAGVLGEISQIDVDSGLVKYKHENVFIESLDLSCNVDEAVSASLSWRAKSWTKASGAASNVGGDTTSMIFDEVEDIGQSFSISISNTLAIKGKLGGSDGEIDYIVGTGQSINITRTSSSFIADGGASETWGILGYNWTGMVEHGEQPIEEDGDILHTSVMQVMTAIPTPG